MATVLHSGDAFAPASAARRFSSVRTIASQQRAALTLIAAALIPCWFALGAAMVAAILGKISLAIVFLAAGLLLSAASVAGAMAASFEERPPHS